MTFPLLSKISSGIPAFFSTDEPYSVLWNFWLVKHTGIKFLDSFNTDFIAYPFGIQIKGIGFLWFLIIHILSLLFTPILAYNIQVIINFFLNFIIVFYLVWFLTSERLSGFISGLIFAFSPYLFVRAWQHLGETYLWMLPMVLLGLFLLKNKPILRFKIFTVSALLISTINFNAVYYIILVMGVYFVSTLTTYFKNHDDYRSKLNNSIIIKNYIFVSIVAFILAIPQFLPIIVKIFTSQSSLASAWNLYHRPFEDLFEQSARPLSYFLPAAVHPLFGKFTEQFMGSKLYGMSFTEHTLYLGWVPLILAFIAFRGWKKKRKESFNVGFFIFLAVAAWLFSQPPWWQIGSMKIYMPSFFMYKILPMFRAYCRFGILLMLAVAVLAGFGLKFILEKFKSNKVKIAIAGLACILVLFEFWNWPPYKVIDVSKFPTVYYWLKAQSVDSVIAEYPLDADSPNEMYRFYQTAHEKKIINGTIPGTEANRVAKTMVKLSKKETTDKLKQWGVRYVLVHRDGYLQTDLIVDKEELNNIPKNSGLRLIKNFPIQDCSEKGIMCIEKTGPIDVYEIINSAEKLGIKRIE